MFGLGRRRTLGAFSVALLLTLMGSACQSSTTTSGGSGKTIRILAAAPLTGDYAETGQDMVNGMQLAADYIKGNGGISAGPMQGANFSIETADDQLSTEAAVTIASRYVDDKGIWALDGFIASGSVLPAAKVAVRSGLAVYSPFSCADFLTTEVHNVLITCTRLESLGRGAIDFGASQFKAKTVSAMIPNYSFEDDIYKGIRDHGNALGVTVTRVAYPYDQADFSALLTNVARNKPDVIGIGDFQANAGRIVSQARAAGLKQPLVDMLCEGWANSFYKVAGTAAASGDVYGCESAPRSFPAGSFGAKILDKWNAKYNRRMTSPAMHGFDSILEIAATIAAGASSRTDLVNLFPKINGGDGLLGPIQLHDNRPIERPLYFLKVTGSTPSDVQLIAQYKLLADGSAQRVQ